VSERLLPLSEDGREQVQPDDALGVATLFDTSLANLRSGAAPFRSLGAIAVSRGPTSSCR
jgi:hypothetical protein